jgi:hypothetical protein
LDTPVSGHDFAGLLLVGSDEVYDLYNKPRTFGNLVRNMMNETAAAPSAMLKATTAKMEGPVGPCFKAERNNFSILRKTIIYISTSVYTRQVSFISVKY